MTAVNVESYMAYSSLRCVEWWLCCFKRWIGWLLCDVQGEAGVRQVLSILRDEFKNTMMLAGIFFSLPATSYVSNVQPSL